MNEWISVKDRLPGIGSYLIMCSEGIHVANFFEPDLDIGYVGGWEVCEYCGGQSQVNLTGDNYGSKFTHWMPLPKPPEEK